MMEHLPTAVPVITVDGPSGVGKGMITRWLSARLGWHRLDSGALYRILALAATRAGVDLADVAAVAALAPGLRIEFVGHAEADEVILVNGEDWTAAVRTEATGGLASQIATAAAVRAALLRRQQDFRQPPGLVADGRDMGTVVFTDAVLKFFIDASPEARAFRRFLQMGGAGLSGEAASATLRALCGEVRARDERDRNRSVAPLVPAADAIIVDTTHLKPAEMLAEIDKALARSGVPQSVNGNLGEAPRH
ncbi:MAG: (d)CMP kinase [Nevskia sp.]|nr:(d)CMP kinase [Nevskia sp.]